MAPMRRSTRKLGRTQKLVLQLLASRGGSTVVELAFSWPSLSESSARSAAERLASRGLVDAVGWDVVGGRRYGLTEVERDLTGLDEDTDE